MGKYSNIRILKILVDCEYYDVIPHMRWLKKGNQKSTKQLSVLQSVQHNPNNLSLIWRTELTPQNNSKKN